MQSQVNVFLLLSSVSFVSTVLSVPHHLSAGKVNGVLEHNDGNDTRTSIHHENFTENSKYYSELPKFTNNVNTKHQPHLAIVNNRQLLGDEENQDNNEDEGDGDKDDDDDDDDDDYDELYDNDENESDENKSDENDSDENESDENESDENESESMQSQSSRKLLIKKTSTQSSTSTSTQSSTSTSTQSSTSTSTQSSTSTSTQSSTSTSTQSSTKGCTTSTNN